MSAVRIRFWLKSGKFLEASVEERDAIKEELNKVYGEVNNFVNRIEKNFLITILVITLIVATLVTACRILGG